MAYTNPTLGGVKQEVTNRGPIVRLAVSSLANKAIEAADITAGNVAACLSSEGKAANLGIAEYDLYLGNVISISSDTNSGNSQDVPTYVDIEFLAPGVILEVPYDTGDAPARGDRVALSTTAGEAGRVRKVAKEVLDTMVSEGTWTFGGIINSNVVIDIDTTTLKVKVLGLNGFGTLA